MQDLLVLKGLGAKLTSKMGGNKLGPQKRVEEKN